MNLLFLTEQTETELTAILSAKDASATDKALEAFT